MLDAIPDSLEDLRAGKIIILVDDEDRENEGDFVCAAEKMTPEIVNFLMRVGAGYLCVAMRPEDCDRLDLTDQAKRNTSVWGTPFTVSVDVHPRHGVGT
ncbi:MAG: 3,4-dihydroxy-2-butanone-4-phosphate synthase, partial [Planctomycetota bacterium]|nr:3,4-dihydroxy-2-butanone-4-phosphate synthase [Planctomycetota bacterium]